jgi:predicted kinase
MKANLLIITIGLPRSGKSTWAKRQRVPIVNPDSIRRALHGEAYIQEAEPMVWALAQYMVRALFLAGHEVVIVDATNTTRERRAMWVRNGWDTVAKTFSTPPAECIERAVRTDTRELIPVIERMFQRWEHVSADEGIEALESVIEGMD